MSTLGAAKLFVKLRGPYLAVPPSGKRVAARIAKDFTTFIEGVTEGYNEQHGTSLSVEQGLVMVLSSGMSAHDLFDQYRGMAESARGFINGNWGGEKGFNEGYKWMNDEFAQWFVYHVLDKPYKIDDEHEFEGAPGLRKVLIEHPNGEKWMSEFVAEFRGFLYPGH
jgi:hypothetical protein